MALENIEQKNKFDRWADSLAIEKDRRDRLWAIMVQNGMALDDSSTYFLLTSGILEQVASLIEASNKAVPDHVAAAAKRAVGPVAEAAGKSLELRLAEQSQHTDSAFKRLMHNFDGQSKKVLNGIEEKVSNLAAERFHSAERRDLIRQYSHIAAAAALVAFIGLAGSAWVFHGNGYAAGRAEAVQVAGSLSSLASREDAGTIAALAAYNPNFGDAITAWCGAGNSSRLETVDGVRKCGPFWVDQPKLGNDSPATFAKFWNFANAPLRGVDPLLTLIGGIGLAALGFFGARRWRGQ